MPRLVLHASNVHVGGGRVLIEGLLAELAERGAPVVLIHDGRFEPKRWQGLEAHAIPPRLAARLRAERLLQRLVRDDDAVLCFGNLPPLFKLRGRTHLYLQNRLLVEPSSYLDRRDHRMRMLIWMEKLWLNRFKHNVDVIYVQTPSMARAVVARLGAGRPVLVRPFLERLPQPAASQASATGEPFDFIYPASGNYHKNHGALIDAWSELNRRGVTPSLALTLAPSHGELIGRIERRVRAEGLRVTNLGELGYEALAAAYRRSRALIYPSKLESLGLPLVEAQALGLPVVAAELDYVRDIVRPAETFDPDSPASIASAVERFLGRVTPTITALDSEGFLREIGVGCPASRGHAAVEEDPAP